MFRFLAIQRSDAARVCGRLSQVRFGAVLFNPYNSIKMAKYRLSHRANCIIGFY